MIITLKNTIQKTQIDEIKRVLQINGLSFTQTRFRDQQTLVVPIESDSAGLTAYLTSMAGVHDVYQPEKPYQLVSREFGKTPSQFPIKKDTIGKESFNLIAGPCSIESRSQIMETAHFLSELGIKFLRGGAYKPRTSPYTFQGLGLEGLEYIREAADHYGMAVVTELLDYHLIDEVAPFADILQVGSRNMFNYYLLKKLGEQSKPVLLKRGMFAKIEEWLLAAEYILLNGNEKVILCERGLRTFDPAVRNQMDISAIPLAKELSHLPVWADPSQGTGLRSLVKPLSLAAVAAGVDGLIIEVHPDPDQALSDGSQSLNFNDYRDLLKNLQPLAYNLRKNLYLSEANKDFA